MLVAMVTVAAVAGAKDGSAGIGSLRNCVSVLADRLGALRASPEMAKYAFCLPITVDRD